MLYDVSGREHRYITMRTCTLCAHPVAGKPPRPRGNIMLSAHLRTWVCENLNLKHPSPHLYSWQQYSVIVCVLCPVRAVLARQEVVRDPILIPIISESLGLTDGDGDPTGRYQYQSYHLYNHIYSHAHAAS